MPSLPSLKLGRRSGTDVVGLDIQPGLVAAVKARVNGAVLAQSAAALPLAADTIREGEVVDREQLSAALRELFSQNRLSKHVRIGIANQRTVMRMLELPPVTDRKELVAAVRFQAQDQVPMPLDNAVLDFHPLGMIDTPAGARQRVVLVAAQRDMVEHLLAAVRAAGLQPDGVDLSAFALIRSLHKRGADSDDHVLYLNVDGLTNLAIAEGTTCRFTRVVGAGLEGMAGEVAARRNIPVSEARELLYAVDLTVSADDEAAAGAAGETAGPVERAEPDSGEPESAADTPEPEVVPMSAEDHEAHELAMGYAESMAAAQTAASRAAETPAHGSSADVRAVLESGIREISNEVRNSLDFHRAQEQGGQVSHVVLSGAVLDVPGFSDALQGSLGIEVQSASVGLSDGRLEGHVSTNRLSVAAGLATVEAPQ